MKRLPLVIAVPLGSGRTMMTAMHSPALSSSLPLRGKLAVFAGDIKIAHTVFALPFALLSTFLAAARLPGRLPRPGQLALVLVCMVTARTIAMAINRLLDAALDAKNPRTA